MIKLDEVYSLNVKKLTIN